MIKYSRTKVIAFDIDEAVSFTGESGPYLQYAVVRANNITFVAPRDRTPDPCRPARGDTMTAQILDGTATVQEMGKVIFEYLLRIASGEDELRAIRSEIAESIVHTARVVARLYALQLEEVDGG